MTDTSQSNVMKRLKDNGLTPINVKISRNIISQNTRPEKKNQNNKK